MDSSATVSKASISVLALVVSLDMMLEFDSALYSILITGALGGCVGNSHFTYQMYDLASCSQWRNGVTVSAKRHFRLNFELGFAF